MIDPEMDTATPAKAKALLIISDSLAGGLGGLTRAQAAWFIDHGWDVTFAAPSDGTVPAAPTRFVEIPFVQSTRRVGQMVSAGRHMRAAWASMPTGAVVHVHGMRSFLLARLAGLPKPFVSVHGTHPSADDPAGYDRLRQAWFAFIPRLARGATTGEPVEMRGWTYHPFASPLLSQLDVVAFPRATSVPTFGWLGLLDTRKRPEVFVRAIAQVAASGVEVRGLLGGRGERFDEIAELITSTGAPVEMLGQTDAADLLRRSWALCLFAASEGTPLAVMEAMWAGRSAVGSDVPGIRHLIGDTGIIADEVDAVANALRALATDHGEAKRRGLAAAARVRTLLDADTPWPDLERDYSTP